MLMLHESSVAEERKNINEMGVCSGYRGGKTAKVEDLVLVLACVHVSWSSTLNAALGSLSHLSNLRCHMPGE